jgi:hypothetical protein
MKTSFTAKNGNKIIVTNFGRILVTKSGSGEKKMSVPFFDGQEPEEYVDTVMWWAGFVTGPYRWGKARMDGWRPYGMENFPEELSYARSTENGYEAIRKLLTKAVELEMRRLPGYEEHYGVSV